MGGDLKVHKKTLLSFKVHENSRANVLTQLQSDCTGSWSHQLIKHNEIQFRKRTIKQHIPESLSGLHLSHFCHMMESNVANQYRSQVWIISRVIQRRLQLDLKTAVYLFSYTSGWFHWQSRSTNRLTFNNIIDWGYHLTSCNLSI